MKKKLLLVAFASMLFACNGSQNISSSITSNNINSSESTPDSSSGSSEVITNIDDFSFETTSLGVLSINGDGGLTITKYVCKRNSTLNVVIPEEYKSYKITRIADSAFSYAGGIATIKLSKNIKYCSPKAFAACSTLKAIYVDDDNINYSSRNDLLYSKDGKQLISGPNGKKEVLIDSKTETIAEYAFSNNETTTFTFEEGVSKIGVGAFERTKKAKSLTLPNSVTEIGEYTFANAEIVELNLGSGITTLPTRSIYQCSRIEKLTIPGNVKNIQYFAISDNAKLNTLILEEGVEELERYSVGFNSYLKNITLPSTLSVIGESALSTSSSLSEITLPEGLKEIKDGAFESCAALKTLYIPSTVTTIGKGITQQCITLKSIVVSENNEYFTVNDSALYSKDMKRLLTVPQHYGEPGYHTFTISNTVETIDDYAFDYSLRINKVVIPESITNIGGTVFSNASALKTIEYLGTKAQWELINKGSIINEESVEWNFSSYIEEVVCSDETIYISNDIEETL